MSLNELYPVSVYPVGLLADLRWLRMAAGEAIAPRWLTRRDAAGYLLDGIRGRLQRLPALAARASYWHGFHAEPADTTWCERAGRGWTQDRARHDLARHMLAMMGARYRYLRAEDMEGVARLAASIVNRWRDHETGGRS